jgi:hypothetical protein
MEPDKKKSDHGAESTSHAPPPPPPPAPPLPLLKDCPKLFASTLHHENLDMNMIVPNLYIGSLESAFNVEALKKLKVTHVLTIEDGPLPDDVHKMFTYKFIRKRTIKMNLFYIIFIDKILILIVDLTDMPYSNLLDVIEEGVEFIENALSNEGNSVLVHW